jgi:hypothetical protein
MNIYKTNTVSNSNIGWAVNLPSPNMVVDRKMYVGATMQFQIQLGSEAAGTTIGGAPIALNALSLQYGSTCALQSFPFSNLIQTGSLTINNSSVSMQVQSLLPILMRSMESHHLAESNGDTPALSDRYYCNFDDMYGSSNNSIFDDYGSNNFSDSYISPRGAFPIKFIAINHYMKAADNTITRNNSLIAGNPAGGGAAERSQWWTIDCEVTVKEPLFLSPLLYEGSMPHNSAGIYGVNAIALNLAMSSSLNRFFSTMTEAHQAGPLVVVPAANMFSNVNLYVKLLTVQPSDAVSMPLRNVLPYNNYVSYLTTTNQTCPPVVNGVWPAQVNLQTVTMSLNLTPNLLFVVVRKPIGAQLITDATSFFTINQCIVQFGNKICLSNYSSYDLYLLSVKNGLQNCSYREWSGQANNVVKAGAGAPAAGGDAAGGGALWTAYGKVATSGSVLILSPADFGLNDYTAPGSSGAQTLQLNLYVTNNSSQAIVPEIVVCSMESGVFVTENAQSQIQSGLLTPDIVLDVKSSATEVPQDDAKEQLGGSMANKHPLAAKHLHRRRRHGGAMSAGSSTAMSAGSSHHHHGNRLKKYFV